MFIFSVLIVALIIFAQLLFKPSPPSTPIQDQNSKFFCTAYEFGTSDWQMNDGFPVLASYSYRTKNWSTTKVKLGVSIQNNNSISLSNVQLDVSYRTMEYTWNTTKANLGFFDAGEERHMEIALTNPYLSLWATRRPVYARYPEETMWENVTVYVLNATELKITAYGYAEQQNAS